MSEEQTRPQHTCTVTATTYDGRPPPPCLACLFEAGKSVVPCVISTEERPAIPPPVLVTGSGSGRERHLLGFQEHDLPLERPAYARDGYAVELDRVRDLLSKFDWVKEGMSVSDAVKHLLDQVPMSEAPLCDDCEKEAALIAWNGMPICGSCLKDLPLTPAATLTRLPQIPCNYGLECEEHGCVHGQEAEELRQRIESLIKDFDAEDPERVEVELQDLLGEVGAGDSLAFLEHHPPRQSSHPPTERPPAPIHEAPIPMRLICPGVLPSGVPCAALHIDTGRFATHPHHTHSCQTCGMTWRPAVEATVGVMFLPGFKNEPTE